MKLSILICTLPEQRNVQRLKRLINILSPQVERHKSEVEIKIHDAGRSMTTGAKRNALIKNCEGDYFCFVDDDDILPVYYVDELLKAIEQGPDVVTFIGYMTTDGDKREDFVIKLGENYERRSGIYYRWPNHLACFKKSVVEHVIFPDQWVQEDYIWSKAIRDRKLLKTEVHIQKEMYIYDFQSNKGNTRNLVRR